MRYTGDVMMAPGPYILHYGIDFNVKYKDGSGAEREYSFNKLVYLGLDGGRPIPLREAPRIGGGPSH